MNLANKITFTRIFIIVAMILALIGLQIAGHILGPFVPNIDGTSINIVNLVVAIVFVVAASTDWLDGYIARKHNMVTDLGKFLDPLADKLLVNSILIFLCTPLMYAARPDECIIPVFMVVIMILRDFAVDGLRLVAVKRNVVVAANIFGKIKTVCQMVTIPILLLGGWPFSLFDTDWPYYLRIGNILLLVTSIISVVSGIIYFVQNKHVFREQKNESDQIS